MTAAEVPIPPEMFYGEAPPLSDEDLDRMWSAAEHVAADLSIDEAAALQVLAGPEDHSSLPAAQAAARWEVTDDTAAWAAAKYAEATAALDGLAVQAEEWRQRIEGWFHQASRRHARPAGFFEQRAS